MKRKVFKPCRFAYSSTNIKDIDAKPRIVRESVDIGIFRPLDLMLLYRLSRYLLSSGYGGCGFEGSHKRRQRSQGGDASSAPFTRHIANTLTMALSHYAEIKLYARAVGDLSI